MSATTSAAPVRSTTAGAGSPGTARGSFEPVIIGFTCNWCSYRAADLAGTARIKYPPNVRLIRLMCSGRIDPAFVLKAFADGADGVIVTGCWPADCHYRIQNVKALRRFQLLRRVVASFGIEPARLQRFYASAAEGQQLAEAFGRIVDEIRALGPLHWPKDGRWASVDGAEAGSAVAGTAAGAFGEIPTDVGPPPDASPRDAVPPDDQQPAPEPAGATA